MRARRDGDEFVWLAECSRCARMTLGGWVDGAMVRVDTLTVPRAHAQLLRRYGLEVFVISRTPAGAVLDSWWPETHDLSRPGRHLLASHRCGALRLGRHA